MYPENCSKQITSELIYTYKRTFSSSGTIDDDQILINGRVIHREALETCH